MDHRDAMAEWGTYLKSLPDFEFNKDTMTGTFVESGEDRDCDSPPKRERSKLELLGAKLDELIADKADRLSDKLKAYTDTPWHGFTKHFISYRRKTGQSSDSITLRDAILDVLKEGNVGHFAKVWFRLSKFGYDTTKFNSDEPMRMPVQRMSLEISLGAQHWLVPEGKTWKERYWPRQFNVKLMVHDQKIGDSWHFKAPFQFAITGLPGIHTLAEVGRRINRRLYGEVTTDDLKPQLEEFLQGREAHEVEIITDYRGNHQGWAVSDEVLTEARQVLGDWVLHFLSLDDKVHTVSLEWEVCGTCGGRGKVVNPSIDAHGITADEFYDDPDFAEDYHRGVYDIPCPECHGRTTSLAIDLKNTNAETLRFIENWFQSEASYRREVAAERRMGC